MIETAPPPLAREAFALAPGLVYLNHAAVGVLPRTTRDALHAMLDDHAARGVLGVASREAAVPAYRRRIAEFIGGRGEEIALLRNTTDGATVLAQGLDFGAGDEVITGANEFGANAYPWFALREHGVVVTLIDAPRERMTPDVLRRTISSRTRVVSVSWVTFDDGYRHDLAALAQVAHDAGALFVVDVAQAVGAFPLDVTATGVDAVYGTGAKWLMALQGVGYLWLREDLFDRVAVRLPGWRSVEDIWNFLDYAQRLARDASRYDGGTPNFAGALSMATSIDVLANAGVERIAAHVLALTDHLVDGLQSRGWTVASDRSRDDVKSGIVLFHRDGVDMVALGRRLNAANVCTTFRANGIRIAPHGYNTPDEIDALLDALPPPSP
ncbi:MAG: aminotransferase class V-fold PLP-dependent enzyme [Candidatus Eremiobacteraeota bacterium]|nr:aminotransferase class V-fold PLP-dependent enzyme [Candidatus Eremiobacteraeota bacterium]MBV9407331.1 aminotransferase class V-fold PLP-dependent enzyme [Candidatus Eremiobacteraeota bacterium]